MPEIRVRRKGGSTKEAAAQWGRQCELFLIRHYAERPYDASRGFTHDLRRVGQSDPQPGPEPGPEPEQAPKGGTTLGAFWPEFVQGHYIANRLRPATRRIAQELYRRYLADTLGPCSLRDIGPAQIQAVKGSMTFLAPRTVNMTLMLLSTVLSRAVEWGYLDRRPKITKIKVPSMDVRPKAYTDAEFEALWQAAQADPVAALVVGLAGLAGLRSSEMLGLQWGDVDLAQGMLGICRGIFEDDVQACKGGRARVVPLSDRLAAVLRVAKGDDGEHVFQGPTGGPARKYVLAHALYRAQDRAKLPRQGPHKLRHTCGTRLADRGVPPDTIRRFLGHADLRTTLLYLHPAEGALAAAAAALDRAPAWRHDGGGAASPEKPE